MAVSYRYVNKMLNVAYLTGFVRRPEKGRFFLQQNNNLEHAIEIRTRPDYVIPREFTPVTVVCHIRGQHIEATPEGAPATQVCFAEAIDIKRPSTRAMPAATAWVLGGTKGTDEFKPYSAEGRLRSELADHADENSSELSDEEKVVRMMIDATKGRLDGRMRSMSSAVALAGFVDSMAYIPPNEFQTNGHGLIMLRQHENPAVNIPVRVANSRVKSIMRTIVEGHPIKVAGRLRRKVVLNKEGEKIGHTLFVETDEPCIAVLGEDIMSTPDWWASIGERLAERRRAAVATRAAMEKAKMVVVDDPDL